MGEANRSEGLRRGLEILGIFKEHQPEWGVSDIARELGLHKNQVHRPLKTLVDAGFLQMCPDSTKYSLGFGAFELGVEAGRRINLVPEARPLLENLASEIQATVSIRVEDGDVTVVVETIESPGRLRVHSLHGNRRTWHFVGSGAKLFSAYLPFDRLDRLIREHGLRRYTENSITRREDVEKELVRIRKQGYAVSKGEHYPDIFGVAAPILCPNGNLLAILVAAMPYTGISKSRQDQIIRKVVQTGKKISVLFRTRAKNNEIGHSRAPVNKETRTAGASV